MSLSLPKWEIVSPREKALLFCGSHSILNSKLSSEDLISSCHQSTSFYRQQTDVSDHFELGIVD